MGGSPFSHSVLVLSTTTLSKRHVPGVITALRVRTPASSVRMANTASEAPRGTRPAPLGGVPTGLGLPVGLIAKVTTVLTKLTHPMCIYTLGYRIRLHPIYIPLEQILVGVYFG